MGRELLHIPHTQMTVKDKMIKWGIKWADSSALDGYKEGTTKRTQERYNFNQSKAIDGVLYLSQNT